MQQVDKTLNEMKELYRDFTGRPAPEIDPRSYASFPPGVDPAQFVSAELDGLRQLSEQLAAAPTRIAWVPATDTFVADDAVVMRADLPGVAHGDLKVFVTAGECVIRGERKAAGEETELRPFSLERPWGPFERRFTLPPGAHGDELTARFHDGVLEVRVPLEKAGVEKEMKVEVV